jgi:alpha-amylase
VGRAFRSRELWKLQSVGAAPKYPDSREGVVFIENHDLQRLAWAQSQLVSFQTTPSLAPLAQVFMLAWPYGYPQVLSSFRFVHYDDGPPIDGSRRNVGILDDVGRCRDPWLCEHRSPEVAPMVQFRNLTDDAFYMTNWWANGTQVAFGRGKEGFVAINSSDETLRQRFQTSLEPGLYCNILGSTYDLPSMTCREGKVRVEADRTMQLEIPAKSAMAFHAGARGETTAGVVSRPPSGLMPPFR